MPAPPPAPPQTDRPGTELGAWPQVRHGAHALRRPAAPGAGDPRAANTTRYRCHGGKSRARMAASRAQALRPRMCRWQIRWRRLPRRPRWGPGGKLAVPRGRLRLALQVCDGGAPCPPGSALAMPPPRTPMPPPRIAPASPDPGSAMGSMKSQIECHVGRRRRAGQHDHDDRRREKGLARGDGEEEKGCQEEKGRGGAEAALGRGSREGTHRRA